MEQSRREGGGVLLRDAAQPRAHPHELQQAVHPVGYSDVGKPDLCGTTKKNTKKEERDNSNKDGRQKGARGMSRNVRQEQESEKKTRITATAGFPAQIWTSPLEKHQELRRGNTRHCWSYGAPAACVCSSAAVVRQCSIRRQLEAGKYSSADLPTSKSLPYPITYKPQT